MREGALCSTAMQLAQPRYPCIRSKEATLPGASSQHTSSPPPEGKPWCRSWCRKSFLCIWEDCRGCICLPDARRQTKTAFICCCPRRARARRVLSLWCRCRSSADCPTAALPQLGGNYRNAAAFKDKISIIRAFKQVETNWSQSL